MNLTAQMNGAVIYVACRTTFLTRAIAAGAFVISARLFHFVE
jgi:hypothetical protein